MLIATCNTGRRASISWSKQANVKQQQNHMMEDDKEPETVTENQA